MTDTDTPFVPRERPKRARISGMTATAVIGLAVLVCMVPYLWALRPIKPSAQPVSIPQTPVQIQQNAAFLKALQSLPSVKRGAYMAMHQDQSRQAALSPDPAQRKQIYALTPKH